MVNLAEATGVSSGRSIPFLIRGFLLALRVEGKTGHTLAYYGGHLERFWSYAQGQGWGEDIRRVDSWRIREFLDWVGTASVRWGGNHGGTRRPASGCTIFHYFMALRRLFAWLQAEHILLENPMESIRMTRPKGPPPAGYSRAEMGQLFKLCEVDFRVASTRKSRAVAARNAALVWAFVSTGLRRGEMASLHLQDVDATTGVVAVRRGKGGKSRHALLRKEALSALLRYLRHRVGESDWLWLTEEGCRLTDVGMRALVNRLCDRSGVKRRGCHAFRRTWAVEAARAGVNLRLIQIAGGWTGLEMVQRYTQDLSEEDALSALASAPLPYHMEDRKRHES